MSAGLRMDDYYGWGGWT